MLENELRWVNNNQTCGPAAESVGGDWLQPDGGFSTTNAPSFLEEVVLQLFVSPIQRGETN